MKINRKRHKEIGVHDMDAKNCRLPGRPLGEGEKVLMVLTSAKELSINAHDERDGIPEYSPFFASRYCRPEKLKGKHPTGAWAEEFLTPYLALKKAGYKVDIVTVGGKPVTFDKLSCDPKFLKEAMKWKKEDIEKFLKDFKDIRRRVKELDSPLKLEDMTWIKLAKYEGVFIPGGHGVMEDLANSKKMGKLLIKAHKNHIPTAAVCHGPSALRTAMEKNGKWVYAGYRITGFTNEEEDTETKLQNPNDPNSSILGGEPLFRQETVLVDLGSLFVKAKPWSSHVEKDRELITGQNPQSTKAITDVFLDELKGRLEAKNLGLYIP